MQEIEVFAFKHQSVVDSRNVAYAIGRPHKQLMRTIQKMTTHLNASINERKFAPVDFFIPATYLDEKGEQRPRFYCTRMGCDLVANKMTGEKGMLFTAAYVTRFHEMDKELAKRAVLREVDKPTQRTLTEAIRDSGEAIRMHGHAYNTYINLVYKAALGRNAGQIRRDRDADKNAHAVDFLTAEELSAVTRSKQHVISLLDMGMPYDEIRELMQRTALRQGGAVCKQRISLFTALQN